MPIESQVTIHASAGASGSQSDWIPLNQYAVPFNVGLGLVTNNDGGVTFRVEHTFDNIFDTSITPTAFIHEDISAATGNIDGNYAFPVRATRLAIASVSASANVTLTVLQTGL